MAVHDEPVRPGVTCLHLDFTYPSPILGTWRIVARSGRMVETLIGTDIPPGISDSLVNMITVSGSTERDELLERARTKPSNAQRFLLSATQEMYDALSEAAAVPSLRIVYGRDLLTFSWRVSNVERDEHTDVAMTCIPGEEITYEEFMGRNPDLASKRMGLSRRDTRKIFVIVKRIGMHFPKAISKNTPLRGI